MIPNAPITPVYGIVPAAGLGRRMGRPKQTLPYWGSTITGRVVRTLLDAELDAVEVVPRSELVARLDLPSDKRLSVAVNDNASSQMIDSIRIGLSVLFNAMPKRTPLCPPLARGEALPVGVLTDAETARPA
ncbi:MAG: NTP transferase domain-containing protein, partial [Chloroflexota bacterium]